jgi:hypothetical protein
MATRGTLQHVSACMGHLQVISYSTRIPSLVEKLALTTEEGGGGGVKVVWPWRCGIICSGRLLA